MAQWLLTTFGWILAAGAAFVTLVVWAARMISGGMSHDMDSCPCAMCQKRRDVRFFKRQQETRRRTDELAMKTTFELQRNWHIEVKGSVYRVRDVRMKMSGYYIYVTNLSTRKDSIIVVTFANASKRVWRRV